MGVFDWVYFNCPKCGNRIEGQSKGGEPYCDEIEWENATDETKFDMVGQIYECRKCLCTIEIKSECKFWMETTEQPNVKVYTVEELVKECKRRFGELVAKLVCPACKKINEVDLKQAHTHLEEMRVCQHCNNHLIWTESPPTNTRVDGKFSNWEIMDFAEEPSQGQVNHPLPPDLQEGKTTLNGFEMAQAGTFDVNITNGMDSVEYVARVRDES
jgi:hypothetical protein